MTSALAQPSDLSVDGVRVVEDVHITEDVLIVGEDDDEPSDDRHRAYAQWVSIEITNYGPRPIKVKNVYTSWGKVNVGNKNSEVKPSYFENTTINPNGSLTIAGCGRSNASSGTEGGFKLVDPARSDSVIRTIYWECPWGKKTNKWRITDSLSGWEVYDKGANLYSGALGNITVETVYTGQ